MPLAMSFSPIPTFSSCRGHPPLSPPRNQPETSFRAGDHVQRRFQPMTKIRTSAYAVRCRVPSDHRHPGGARTYNDNSGQALFEHRIVDGLPIVKRQFSRETWGGATVVPHGRRSHRNSLRPLQPLGACARKRERGEGRGKEKKKKVKGKISWGKRERGEIGCRRDIYVTRWRGQRICIFDVSIMSFFPLPFHFHLRPIRSFLSYFGFERLSRWLHSLSSGFF